MHRQRLAGVDLLRGLAAGVVFLFHYATMFTDYDLSLIVGVALNVFVLMGGYFTALASSRDPFDYAKKRIVRLLIPLAAVLALYLAVYVVRPELSRIPSGWQSVPYLLLNFSALNVFTPWIQPIMTASWTVGILLWPSIAVLYARQTRSAGIIFSIVGVISAIYLSIMCAFLIGVVLALIPRKWWWVPLLGIAPFHPLVTVSAIVFFCFLEFPAPSVATQIGAMSYSFYLVHSFALHLTRQYVPVWRFPAGLALSCLFTFFLYRYVELPASKLLSNRKKSIESSDSKSVQTASA